MNETTTPEHIEYRRGLAASAAAWWSDRLRAQRPPELIRDAGYRPSEGSVYVDLLARTTPCEVEEQAVDRFEAILCTLISKRAEEDYTDSNGRWYGMHLSVDYGPDNTLSDAIVAAGLKRAPLPYKTTMWISEDGIKVSMGYRAPREWICLTKHAHLVGVVDPGGGFPSRSDDQDEAIFEAAYQAWETRKNLLHNELNNLPPFPEGDVDTIAATIRASVERQIELLKTQANEPEAAAAST